MNKKTILGSLVLASVLFTTGCMEEKQMPADQLITIYDSNLKETNKLAPLETMYVKIAGLAPNELHKIEILDANQNVISQAEVFSGDDGVIEPLPIWYDVGLEKEADGTYSITKQDLSLKAFYVRVTSLANTGTDFKQDFYLLLKKPDSPEDMPKSIVTSVSVEDGNISNAQIENTFLETGSKNPDGSDSNLTKVYVKADQLPYHTIKDGEVVNTDKVDIYVVPFAGSAFEDGMDLASVAVTSRKDVPTDDNVTFRTLEPTLIWDLNKAPQLKNPGDSNNAYSIIIDTNQNGKFDIGEDLDGDGKYDRYIDGVDGQSVAGFIIMNTEANDLNYIISDANNNKLDSISETESRDMTELYLTLNNIPTTEKNATIFVINKDATDLEDGLNVANLDVRNDNSDGSKGTLATINEPDNENTFMPYINSAKFLNTIADSAGYGYNDDINDKTPLDIVVDINNNGVYDKGVDYYFPNAVTILPFDTNVTTAIDSNGSEVTSLFNEANSDSNTTVYIKYGDTNTGSCSTQKYAYLYPISQTPTDGDELFGEILRQPVYTDNNCVTKFIDSTELLNNNILKIINPTDENNKYVIVIDKDDNHKYNSDTDKLLYISFKDTQANSIPDVSYINLASGGLMGQPYEHWVDTPYANAYDYRDTFTVNAEDTIPTEWWWASYYTTKGIKVVWNPYMKTKGWWGRKTETYIDEQGNEQNTTLLERQVVDLYIVDANKYKLSMDMNLTDEMDIRGRHITLPVQFSCRNGAYLQTIWQAPLTVGKYYVIVDINRNHKVDNGIDLIDATTKNGITIKDDPSVVGFSVVE